MKKKDYYKASKENLNWSTLKPGCPKTILDLFFKKKLRAKWEQMQM